MYYSKCPLPHRSEPLEDLGNVLESGSTNTPVTSAFQLCSFLSRDFCSSHKTFLFELNGQVLATFLVRSQFLLVHGPFLGIRCTVHKGGHEHQDTVHTQSWVGLVVLNTYSLCSLAHITISTRQQSSHSEYAINLTNSAKQIRNAVESKNAQSHASFGHKRPCSVLLVCSSGDGTRASRMLCKYCHACHVNTLTLSYIPGLSSVHDLFSKQ